MSTTSALTIDFITSLDGYGAADGWPGFWGLEGPEYLGWLEEQAERPIAYLMGATTYREMAALVEEGEPGTEMLAGVPKVVFSSTLTEPLAWPNTTVVRGDAVEAVRDEGQWWAGSTHDGEPVPVSFLTGGRLGRPFPGRGLPRDHRQDGPGSHLRRLPRRRP